MATAYTPILQLALPVTGELQGTWGTVVNDNITSMIEQAIAGLATINTWTTASHTLTTANGTTSEARCAVLECSGAPGATATVICPTSTKLYVIKNSVTGGFAVTLKTSAGTGISVPNGSTALLYCDGTNVVSGATYMATLTTTQVDILAQGDLRLQDSTGGEYVALQAPATIATSYTLTLPVDDGTAGQALITDGSGVLSWSTAASGDVYGPASATDNAVARFDLTTGKLIQNSVVTIADDGATVIAANSASDGLRITQLGAGNALVVEDETNPDATSTVITAAGAVRIGSSTSYNTVYGASQFAPGFQLYNTAGTGGFYRYSADQDGSALIFAKSRSATLGTQTVVNSGDTLGYLGFAGSDGTNFTTAANIVGQVDGTPGTGDMPGRLTFNTTADGASSPTERMRINSSGNVGIGNAISQTDSNLTVNKNLTGATTAYGVRSLGTIQTDVTSAVANFQSQVSTVASAFTLTNLRNFYATQGTIGAGSTVTSQFGFVAESTLTGATNNYGFYGAIASGTGRFNFYAAGTADNYFAGNVGIGTSSPILGLTIKNDTGSTTYGQRAGSLVLESNNVTSGGGTDVVWSTGTQTNQRYASIGSAIVGNDGASGSRGDIAFATKAASATTTLTERMRIDRTGTISLGAAPGSESLRVTPVASAVNFIEVLGASTGISPVLQSTGSDTNVSAVFATKGTGAHLFRTNGNTANTQFQISHTASAVNFFTVYGNTTGNSVLMDTAGSDTNVGAAFRTKGTGDFFFYTGDYTRPQFRVGHTASAVNYITAFGNTTSNGGYFQAAGSDTNISMLFSAKGTGGHVFYTAGNSFTPQFAVTHTASAVNYLSVSGAVTSGIPFILAQGSDTDVSARYGTKGNGFHAFFTNSTGSNTQFLISNTASAVNYLQVTGSASTTPTLSAQGSGADLDILLTPKGTGNVRFGTHTAGVVAQAGYITIKDAGGTTRRLLVG